MMYLIIATYYRPTKYVELQNVTNASRARFNSVEIPILFFAVCAGTEIRQVECACSGEIAVCNAFYRLTISYFVPLIFAIIKFV